MKKQTQTNPILPTPKGVEQKSEVRVFSLFSLLLAALVLRSVATTQSIICTLPNIRALALLLWLRAPGR